MTKPWWREVIETVVYALVLALFLRWLVIQAFWIPSGSMIPTLLPNDRVLVLKFWYRLPKMEPKRGDIVVFKYPVEPERDFVKRLIGLPGDTVEIVEGRVFVNNLEITEPYVQNRDSLSMEPLSVPHDQYFFLGDNRSNSQDGRYWRDKKTGDWIPFVPRNYIRGPAVFRYWPLSRIGLLK